MNEILALEERIAALIAAVGVDEAAFNDAALAVYRFQRSCNEPFENYCRHLGVPREIEDWRAIPAVPQSAFKQFALRSFSASETVKTFRTSGTTGEGFGEHHFRSLRLYDESIVRTWDFFRLPQLPQIILAPTPEQAPHSSLSHMFGVLRERARGGIQHFCIGDDGALRLDKLCRVLPEAHEPVMLLGTALAFLHFFETGEKFRLPEGSCAMETGGYKGSGRTVEKRELYELFGEHLGLVPDAVVNEYGMTELSAQFYTRGVGRAHHGPPWARALVIDPETGREVVVGEMGSLRILDLANVGSVIAIQTRDLAIRREAGFELIGRDPTAIPRGCSRAADDALTS